MSEKQLCVWRKNEEAARLRDSQYSSLSCSVSRWPGLPWLGWAELVQEPSEFPWKWDALWENPFILGVVSLALLMKLF